MCGFMESAEALEQVSSMLQSLRSQQVTEGSQDLPLGPGSGEGGICKIEPPLYATGCCFCCEESNTRIMQQQQAQQQLSAAYARQQQELHVTSGALVRALAETTHLREYLRALESRALSLEEAAGRGEAALLERGTLGEQLSHLQVQGTTQVFPLRGAK